MITELLYPLDAIVYYLKIPVEREEFHRVKYIRSS